MTTAAVVGGILALCGVVGGVVSRRAKTRRAKRAGAALEGIAEAGKAAAPVIEQLGKKR